jgi:hypothetical protein
MSIAAAKMPGEILPSHNKAVDQSKLFTDQARNAGAEIAYDVAIENAQQR